MRSFLLRALVFVLLGVFLDQAAGRGLEALFSRSLSGQGGGDLNHLVQQTAEVDVVFFGSSRVRNHVDPAVIEEVTGLKAWNAGANGQGLPYALGVQAVLEAPARCHVLQVDLGDLIAPDMGRTLFLAPFLRDHPDLLPILAKADPRVQVKRWSRLWPFNSALLSILRNTGRGPRGDGKRGFAPLKGRKRGQADNRGFGRHVLPVLKAVHPDAIWALDRFVEHARSRGAGVWLFTSPGHQGVMGDTLLQVRADAKAALTDAARARGIRYTSYDEFAHPEFQPRELFVDRAHLNREGAELFSRTLAADLATGCAPLETP